jgi:O-antigen ligase
MIFRSYQFIYLSALSLVYAIFLFHFGFIIPPLLFTLLGMLLCVLFKKNHLIIFSFLIPILPAFAGFIGGGFPDNYLILPLLVLTGMVVADSIINKEFLSAGKETIPRHYVYYLLILSVSFIFVMLRWSNILLSKMAFLKNTPVDISGERLSFAIIFPILELALFVLSVPYFAFCQCSLNKNKLVMAFLSGQCISVLFAMGQYVLNKPIATLASRVAGLASDPTAFGMLCAISFIMAWYLGRKGSFKIAYFFVIVFLIGMIISSTRVAYIALLIIPFIGFRKIKKSAVWISGILALLILIFVFKGTVKTDQGNSVAKIEQTVATIINLTKGPQERSTAINSITSNRDKIWGYALAAIKQFPLTGIGAGNFLFWGKTQFGTNTIHHLAANQYLFVAVSNGLLGAGLFILFIITILLKKQWLEKMVILVLLLMFLFNDYLWFSEVFLGFWLICSLGEEKKLQKAGKKEKLFILALVLFFIVVNILNNSALLPSNWSKTAGVRYDYGLYYIEREKGQQFQWTGEKAGIYIYLDQNGRNNNFRLFCGAPHAFLKNREQVVDIFWRGRFFKRVIFRDNNEYPILIEDKECREGFLEFRIRPGFNLNRMNLGKETRILGVQLFGADIPGIQLLSPNGGENWLPGSVQDIRWQSKRKVTAVKIEMSYDGGRSYSKIADSIANNGIYSWKIKDGPSMNCVIRISSESGAVTDASDQPFVIASPPSMSGLSFAPPKSWADSAYGSDDWYVGDFNGDGRSDIMKYADGESGSRVLLSDGNKFVHAGIWTGAGCGVDGWYVGDFNGDGRSDIMRYLPNILANEVFLSTGTGFASSGNWLTSGNGSDGWTVGDFNGDGRSDLLRVVPNSLRSDVFLSNGKGFVFNGNWSGAGNGSDGWYVGDFNGDGRSDLMRFVPGKSGAEVFLSDGVKFVYANSWTGANPGVDGWYVGDFNGDKKCDMMRYAVWMSGSDVFLAGDTEFVHDGNWSSAGRGDADWVIGDFNGDGRSDLLRYIKGVTGGDILLSGAGGGAVLSRKPLTSQIKWENGRWLGDMPFADGLLGGREEKEFFENMKKRTLGGEKISVFQIQKEYEKLKARKIRRVTVLRLIKHYKVNK